jgi:hypothetical protein
MANVKTQRPANQAPKTAGEECHSPALLQMGVFTQPPPRLCEKRSVYRMTCMLGSRGRQTREVVVGASGWFRPTLRISGVSITRDDLQRRLGRAVDRFERARSGRHFYAQVDPIVDGDLWFAISGLADQIGTNLQDLLQTGEVKTANLDLGLSFFDGAVNVSAEIPSSVAASLGRLGINITVSAYLTSDVSQSQVSVTK